MLLARKIQLHPHMQLTISAALPDWHTSPRDVYKLSLLPIPQ